MHIRRDYSRSFFSDRRRRGAHVGFRAVLIFSVFLTLVIMLYINNYDRVQLAAMEALNIAPAATARPGEQAAEGLQNFYSGELDAAITELGRAVRQEPDNIAYLYEYGMLLMEADRFEEAIVVADHALEVAPEDPRSYTLKGRALMWEDPPQAIQIALQGLDRDPDFAPLYAIQGVAYTNLGRWQEGLRNATRAVELNPNDIFVQMSYQWPATYRGDFRGAIDALKIATGLNPNLVTPYFYLAALYALPQVGEPEMAIATYNHIIEMQPDNAKAYLRLCQTYARVDQARFDIAQPYCDEAIAIDPNYGDAYGQRGMMQYARRNYEGAIESFDLCIENGSTMLECEYLRGFSYYRLGDCDPAWEISTHARELAVELGNSLVIENVDFVLDAITDRCAGYSGQSVPTTVPPTSLPPTPIGGFG